MQNNSENSRVNSQKYNPKSVETKWQNIWFENNLYAAESETSQKPKKYILVEFPYPSGAALHVGHAFRYTVPDVVSRYSRMNGFNVLFPFGYDAFGLPTEERARKDGKNPVETTKENIEAFRGQIKRLGYGFDWSREFATTDPEYYKWTQWIFGKMFEKGLVEQREVELWWCPAMATVLANEEVLDDPNNPGQKISERGEHPVERKKMKQWVIKITEYAESLLNGLNEVDWPENIKDMQRNWIGKSEGAEVVWETLTPKNTVLRGGADFDAKIPVRQRALTLLKKKGKDKYLVEKRKKDDYKICFFAGGMVDPFENAYDAALRETEEEFGILKKDLEFKGKICELYHADKYSEEKIKELSVTHPRLHSELKVENTDTYGYFEHWYLFEVQDNFERVAAETDKKEARLEWVTMEEILNNGWEHLEVVAEKLKSGEFLNKNTESAQDHLKKPNLITFTTRIDTLPAVSFIAIAPEFDNLQDLVIKEQKEAVDKYLEVVKNKSERERNIGKDKNGVWTGSYARNPLTSELVPIFVADYVLSGYGSGAVMGVAGHDERDYEFAKNLGLKIKYCVAEDIFVPEKYKTQEGAEVLKRRIVDAIIEKDGEYFVLKKKNGDMHFVTGGVESGETEEEAILREIKEEVGFIDIKSVEKVPRYIHFKAFNSLKNRNTETVGPAFKVTLNSLEKINCEVDQGRFEVVKMTKDELQKSLKWENSQEFFRVSEMGSGALFADSGIMFNSGEFDGLNSEVAREKIIKKLEEKGLAKKKVNYKLRDWVFSRQRYWGEPFPFEYRKIADAENNDNSSENIITEIDREKYSVNLIKDEDLPLVLPDVKDYEPSDDGRSPLAKTDWINIMDENGKVIGKHESDTMPNWAGSSWYFLRFTDPKNNSAFASPEKLKYWLPVDHYFGGNEHTTLHLLYSRMWHQFLYDQDLVPTQEPYKMRTNGGMLLGEDGRKMSKSLGNVISPDEKIKVYGADALRLYINFIGPYDATVVWQEGGLKACKKFLDTVWSLQEKVSEIEASKENWFDFYTMLEKVNQNIKDLKTNVCVAEMMTFVNKMKTWNVIPQEVWDKFILVVAPFAPHLADELWHISKGFDENDLEKSVHLASWPEMKPEFLVKDIVKYVVQVNGKVRGDIEVSTSASEEEIVEAAKSAVQKWLDGKALAFTKVIPRKLVTLVVK